MEPCKVYPSPSGHLELRLYAYSQRHSHETESPALFKDDICVFFPGSLWHVHAAEWSENGERLDLDLRHYDWPELAFKLRLWAREMRGELSNPDRGWFRASDLDALAEDMTDAHAEAELLERLFNTNRG